MLDTIWALVILPFYLFHLSAFFLILNPSNSFSSERNSVVSWTLTYYLQPAHLSNFSILPIFFRQSTYKFRNLHFWFLNLLYYSKPSPQSLKPLIIDSPHVSYHQTPNITALPTNIRNLRNVHKEWAITICIVEYYVLILLGGNKWQLIVSDGEKINAVIVFKATLSLILVLPSILDVNLTHPGREDPNRGVPSTRSVCGHLLDLMITKRRPNPLWVTKTHCE